MDPVSIQQPGAQDLDWPAYETASSRSVVCSWSPAAQDIRPLERMASGPEFLRLSRRPSLRLDRGTRSMTVPDRRSADWQAVLAWLLVAVTVLACIAQALLLRAQGVRLFSADAL